MPENRSARPATTRKEVRVAVGRRIKVQGRRSLGLVCETRWAGGNLIEVRAKFGRGVERVDPELIVSAR